MPDVRLPNGKIIKNVPANMTPEQKARFAEMAKAYYIPGVSETESAVAKEESAKKKEWLGARDNLSKTRDLRYKALRSIDTPEKLAEAYGFKPENFKPEDLQSQFDSFQTQLGSGDWWNRKAPHIGALGANLANATMAPFMFGKQVYTRSTGNQYDVNNNTLGNMVEQELLHAQTGDKPVSSFLGAAIGSTPIALATGGSGSLPSAALSGAVTAAATPNPTSDSMLEQSGKKGLIGAAFGLGGGALAHTLSAAPKAVAGVTKQLPPLAAENQSLIMRALKLAKGDISAADLAQAPDGLKTLQSNIVGWRNNAQASGKAIARKNEGNLARMNQTTTELADEARAGFENTPFINGENPQGLAPRQAIQESLPMELGRRQQDIVTPLYDAITPKPPDVPVSSTNLLATIDELIGRMKASKRGSKYTSPMTTGREGQSGPSALNVLEEQRMNLVGDPTSAVDHLGIQPTPGRGPVVGGGVAELPKPVDHLVMAQTPGRGPVVGGGETIPAVRDIYGTVVEDAIHPAPMTTGPIGAQPASGVGPRPMTTGPVYRGSGEAPWDSVYGLMKLRDNLQHNINQYGFGNAQTRPLTETLAVVDEMLSRVHATPEWQAHIASTDAAKASAATQTKPYQQDIVQNLLQKRQGGQTVTPDQSFTTLKGYQPDQIGMIRGLLEQKGGAALDTAWIDDLLRGARNETAPTGLQVERDPLIKWIASPQTQSALSPEYLAKMNEIRRALELMDQIGTRQPSVAPATTLAVGAGSQRGMLRAGWELLGSAGAPLLFNERIKAMLLTPSFHNSNLVPGMVRSGAQNVVSGAGGATAGAQRDTWGIDNPMPRP